VQVVVAQDSPAALANAAPADVKPHVTAIALGKEDGLLENGHIET
jgi:hypothetical protein